MRKLTVAIDVDEVCADLLGEWLRRYNRDTGDTLTVDDVTRWDMREVCRQTPYHNHPSWVESGWSIYDYLTEPDIYDHVLPTRGARNAVYEMAAQGHRILFVSSCVIGSTDAKMRWLQRWRFLPPEERSPKHFVAAADKSLIRADVLIDDRLENVEAFPGDALLVTRPYNAKLTTTRVRINGLHEASEVVNWIAGAQAPQPCVPSCVPLNHLVG